MRRRKTSNRPPLTHTETVSLAKATRLLDGLMERASAGQVESLTATILDRRDAFSSLEQSIASAAIGGALLETDADWDRAASAAKVLRNLDAPTTSIARSTNSLVQKLEEFS